MLLIRLLVLKGSDLRVWSSIDRKNIGILSVKSDRITIHAETVLVEKLIQMLSLPLNKMRLIYNDEGVASIHLILRKILVKEDLDRAVLVILPVILLGVFNRLVTKFDLTRTTEDVDMVDISIFKHKADELMISTRLTRLTKSHQNSITNVLQESTANVLSSDLLVRVGHDSDDSNSSKDRSRGNGRHLKLLHLNT